MKGLEPEGGGSPALPRERTCGWQPAAVCKTLELSPLPRLPAFRAQDGSSAARSAARIRSAAPAGRWHGFHFRDLSQRCDGRGLERARGFRAAFWVDSTRQVPAVCALAVVDVPGDGNCLFHALAMQDKAGRCGEELRAELANFLESKAFHQDGFEEVWLEEAEHLRGPAAECWGGAVAISAYSLLRQRRVFVHVKVAGSDAAEVQDSSHALVDADAPVATTE